MTPTTRHRVALAACALVAAAVAWGCSSEHELSNLPAPACAAGKQDCFGECVDLATDPANCGACKKACGTGELCSVGTCALSCNGGTTKCAGKCVDTRADEANCGGCGNACAPGAVCSQGACALTCEGSTTKCAGKCVDTATDPANCGACGKECGDALVCSNGQCALTCEGGSTKCGSRCVVTSSDAANCGSCGNACTGGQVCSGGTCSLACAGGATKCGTKCVDTNTDPANCGACGNACTDGRICSSGTCSLACAGGATKCGTKCVDTSTDPANCGACGNACTDGRVCSSGTCSLVCTGGATKCGAVCVDTAVDAANCGACGHACAEDETCSLGRCTKAGPTSSCNGVWVDTSINPKHCGACGNACPAGSVCSDGACGCTPGDSVCATGCANLSTNSSNCGACGNACGDDHVCSGGACVKLTLGTGGTGGSLTGANPPKVAVMAIGSAGGITDLQAKLEATELFASIGTANFAPATVPSVATMKNYDAIVTWTNTSVPAAYGDNLAEYLEAGGGVVLGDYQTRDATNGLKGRYEAQYTLSTLVPSTDWVKTAVTLGTIREPNSPLLTAVSTFGYQGTTPAHLPAKSFNKNNPTVVAEYSDGTPAVVRGVINGHTVVEINGFGASSAGNPAAGWDPSTDGARLFANALLFTIPPPTVTTARQLDFGNQPAFSTSPAKTVTYTNASGAPKTIVALNVSGTHIGDFALAPESGLPMTLQPGATLTVNVGFSPSGTGLRAATLAATVTGANGPATTLLTGTGN